MNKYERLSKKLFNSLNSMALALEHDFRAMETIFREIEKEAYKEAAETCLRLERSMLCPKTPGQALVVAAQKISRLHTKE